LTSKWENGGEECGGRSTRKSRRKDGKKRAKARDELSGGRRRVIARNYLGFSLHQPGRAIWIWGERIEERKENLGGDTDRRTGKHTGKTERRVLP